jgi:hypothetical protein
MSNTTKWDKHQKLRLRRMGLALTGAIVLTIICVLFFEQNILMLSKNALVYLLSAFWIINLLFLSFILSGLNQKLKDPSLTLPQMIWAISTTMVVVYFSTDLRAVLLMLSLLVIMFGSLNCSGKKLYGIILYSLLCYVFIIFFQATNIKLPSNTSFIREIITLFVYALVSLVYGILAEEFFNIRKHLHEKYDLLETKLQKQEKSSNNEK